MLALLLAAACTPTPTEEASFTPTASTKVDLLFIVDNSASMEEEQDALHTMLASGFGGWSGVDLHLGAATTDDATVTWVAGDCGDECLQTWLPALAPGIAGSDQEAGLGVAIAAMTPPLSDGVNSGFVRAGALHAVLFVTDESDCSGLDGAMTTGEDCYPDGRTQRADAEAEAEGLTPVTELLQAALAIDPAGRVQMSGYIGPSDGSCEAAAVPGRRYSEAISRLGGVEASICAEDYTEDLAAIQAKQLAPPDRFLLPDAAIEASIEVTVDGDDVPADEAAGWSYDAELQMIVLNGAAAPGEGEVVVFRYAML